LLTYLKLAKKLVGLLINFGAATLKEGITRVINAPKDFSPIDLLCASVSP
jgi:iron complex transport system substrate-binding protein